MSKKILLVDDDPDLRAIVAMRIQAAGYELKEAEDGNQALEVVGDFKPDVILLDVMMPGLDGFETCAKLREMEEFANTPVIFLSARSEDWDMITGFSQGANSYLVKPVEFELLFAEIEKVLS